MNKIKAPVHIAGTGLFVPEKVLTNAEIEKMVDTSDDWIITRTGIKERRVASSETATSDMATKAAQMALNNAHLKASELDIIINATVTPDMIFPSTACFVQNNLGAKNAFCFDVAAACSGFIYGLEIGSRFLSSGGYKNALVIGAEKMTAITDFTDRNTCVLFGDAAGAAVLKSGEGDAQIIGCYLGSDGSTSSLLQVPGGGSRVPATEESVRKRLHFIKMEGREVFKYAVRAMDVAATTLLERHNLTAADLGLLIPHQANLRIIDAIKTRLGLKDEQVFVNVHKYGNVSAGSVPVALHESIVEGRIRKGDYVLLVAFGAGFTWGSCLIKW